ncbi:hypothetical protein PV08_02158 [Exophiala spinifera]|uniref:Heterokaryon incompatibility domain-containing protein n=1 Tax=Exophiala spinifera TaxID=91928 RepID=A0A0D2BRB2_9EURO|nr:uncharacterized protein PV08_02158 [Exophiala spinifera]KIW21578.1 hypothetical protein PV08_02158 [Exophiala spinifera]
MLKCAHRIMTHHRADMRKIEGNRSFTSILRAFRDGQNIICSIHTLVETLADMTAIATNHNTYVWAEGNHHFVFADDELHVKPPKQEALRMRLLERGWCPNDVEYITNTFALCRQYYISNLRRRASDKPHTACSSSLCFLKDNKSKFQQPKHRHSKCNCISISTQDDRVTASLKDGKIPRIHICPMLPMKDNTGQCEIKNSGKYVAISHVWSHGLGNSSANELPQCQILYLQQLVQNLYPPHHCPVHLWIDTLCIPAESEGKKLGLRLLKKAFHEADKVLVIDLELLDIHSVSDEEILIRINRSEWMRRLWTLNEAVISGPKLHVQLSQRAVDFKTLLGWHCPADGPPESSLPGPESVPDLDHDTAGHFAKIWAISMEKNLFRRLAKLIPVLHRRRVTDKADETICIATALGLPVEPLLDCHPELRMKTLISMLLKIPCNVIFSNAPRLGDIGLRWAPKTLLTGDLDFMNTNRAEQFYGSWTGSGISVRLGGFELHVYQKRFIRYLAHIPLKKFYFSYENKWLFATLVIPDGQETLAAVVTRPILRFALAVDPSFAQRRAILLGVHNEERHCIEVTYLARYNIGFLGDSFKQCAENIKRCAIESGYDLNPDISDMNQEERDSFEQINAAHEGLFALGASAAVNESYSLGQEWHIQ